LTLSSKSSRSASSDASVAFSCALPCQHRLLTKPVLHSNPYLAARPVEFLATLRRGTANAHIRRAQRLRSLQRALDLALHFVVRVVHCIPRASQYCVFESARGVAKVLVKSAAPGQVVSAGVSTGGLGRVVNTTSEDDRCIIFEALDDISGNFTRHEQRTMWRGQNGTVQPLCCEHYDDSKS